MNLYTPKHILIRAALYLLFTGGVFTETGPWTALVAFYLLFSVDGLAFVAHKLMESQEMLLGVLDRVVDKVMERTG